MAQKGSKLKLQKDIFIKAMKMTQAEDRKHAHLKTCILYKKKSIKQKMIAEIKETKMIATLDQCHALIALLPQTKSNRRLVKSYN